MALQTFTWKNGTNEHPVELNPAQISLLLKLALDTNVQSDVRGHITTSSGRIAKYTKWQLSQKYGENLVIHAEEDDDVFSLIPVRNAINEGESTVITVTGMSASSVKFRLLHSFRNVYGINQAAAQARIHMEGNTLVVNQPEENASWTDEVTIQAIPLYEEWSTVEPSGIASCTVTVTAKEITGIALTAPSMVVYGEMFQSEVTLIPSSNTKKNFVTLDAICITDGSIPVRKPTTQGGYIYMQAPSEQCNLTLTVNAYLFNDLDTIVFSAQGEMESAIPYIRFTVTTDGTFGDISTANPKITLQKVDSQDTPIGEPVVLTGTVSGSSLVYTYTGVKGDGSEIYKVTIDKVNLYKVGTLENVVPNDVITLYNINYAVFTPDIYIVKTDGTKITYEQFVAGGFVVPNNAVAIEVELEDTSYFIDLQVAYGAFGRYNSRVDNGVFMKCTTFDELLEDKNGYIYTNIIHPISDGDSYADDTIIDVACNTTKIIGDKTYRGYIPAFGELYLCIINRNVFAILNSYSGNSGHVISVNGFNIYTTTISLNNNNIEDPLFIRGINQNGPTGIRRTALNVALVFLKELTV